MFTIGSDVAVILATGTASLLILTRDWRWRIGLLALQYLAVFSIVLLSWPAGMSVTILIAGWMAGTLLGMAFISLGTAAAPHARTAPDVRSFILSIRKIFAAEIIFRFLCIILVILIVFAIAPRTANSLPVIPYNQILMSLMLLCLGLLQLFLNSGILSTTVGLLTFISGFEVLYSTIEAPILVAGLLALITLGIALVGAYLLLAPQMEPEV